jgi:hypothetical protein
VSKHVGPTDYVTNLVNMWDPERKHFIVQDQVLTLEMEDMYFLTRLLCCGVTMVLVGGKRESAE